MHMARWWAFSRQPPTGDYVMATTPPCLHLRESQDGLHAPIVHTEAHRVPAQEVLRTVACAHVCTHRQQSKLSTVG